MATQSASVPHSDAPIALVQAQSGFPEPSSPQDSTIKAQGRTAMRRNMRSLSVIGRRPASPGAAASGMAVFPP